MKIFVACIVLALAINASIGCYTSLPSIAKYKWSDDWLITCEYQGMKFMPGSKWVDATNCQSCSCTNDGLSCCGIGYYSGPRYVRGCTVVADFCKAVVLNKAKTALCHK